MDASDERLKGVTPVEKHLCVNYRVPSTPSPNNGYCVNHLLPVFQNLRPPSVTFQTAKGREAEGGGVRAGGRIDGETLD